MKITKAERDRFTAFCFEKAATLEEEAELLESVYRPRDRDRRVAEEARARAVVYAFIATDLIKDIGS